MRDSTTEGQLIELFQQAGNPRVDAASSWRKQKKVIKATLKRNDQVVMTLLGDTRTLRTLSDKECAAVGEWWAWGKAMKESLTKGALQSPDEATIARGVEWITKCRAELR